MENERIAFRWPSSEHGLTRVEMVFKPLQDGDTMVQISESGWPPTEKGFAASHGNAGGWMHMMCCLKARLEYDINLRAGGAL